MIVELIGCSGAGKTTLTGLVRDREGWGVPVVSIDDLIMDRWGVRRIRDPKGRNLVADVTVLPSFLRGLDRNAAFVRFAARRLLRHAPSTFAKVNYLREVVRDVGKHELARRASDGATVLVDEGAVLTAYHLFVYSDAPVDREALDAFAELVPLPDRIVYVTAPLEVLVDRSLRRPDRRRELAAGDRRDLERWIARAVEVFDGLVASPRIRERLLVVDTADGSSDGRAAVATQIARFIGDRAPSGPSLSSSSGGRLSPARGGRVIAFVGSEATGKSTILGHVRRWLGATHAVRRIHVGKPPATVLTVVPHVLLPALRALLPDQRSTRIERSYGRAERPMGPFPLLFGVRSVMLAYERRALLARAFAWSRDGAIVLCDRYPSTWSGGPDGPQLAHLPAPDGLRRRLVGLEARLYGGIPPADLVIHLTAPLEVALARNAARGKIEPEEHVRFRHSLSSELGFDGAVVRRIGTDRPLETVVREVEEAIRDAL